jgi:hypothetical protein
MKLAGKRTTPLSAFIYFDRLARPKRRRLLDFAPRRPVNHYP